MMLTKGAIGNLINRYSAVLKKCSLINTFGSLAVAGMLVVGSVAAAGAAASIGETQYGTLKEAVEKATSGATITLTKEELEAGGIIYETGKNLVIDLNNNIYKATHDPVGSSGYETQIFQLLRDSNITIKNGSITADDPSFKMGLQNYSNLTLDNVILEGTKTIGYLLSNNYGNINIKNSTIDAKQVAFDVYYWPSGKYEGVAVAIEGSIINGRIEVTTDKTAAIGNNTHSLTMTNCTLGGGLTTTSDGGQLYAAGTTTISNVAFNQNKATNGGAIYNTVEKISDGAISGRGILNLNNTTFTNNTATTNGGAIYNSGTLTLEGTNTFKGNIATDKGNDIYNTGTVTIKSGTTTLGSYGDKAAFVQAESGTLTLNGGTLVADLGNFVSKLTTTGEGDSKVVTATLNGEAGISDASVIGTKGNLNLRADGLTYTSDEYQAARAALFGQKESDKSIENAVLTFVGATLELTKDAEGNGKPAKPC